MAFVRGANPIWFMVDLFGQPLNDSCYAFFLTNTLPYQPQPVYRDPQGLTVWTGGVVQFQANGTLPNNLYFDDSLTYRIEFRAGPTQSDPLVAQPIENYQLSPDAINPPGGTNTNGDNQITNPEFVEVFFNPDPISHLATFINQNLINIAPGWDIVLQGSGTVTVQRIPISGADNIPNNPAYVLQITTTGSWTSAILRQRFYNNGALFRGTTTAPSAIAGTFVAKRNSLSDFMSGLFYEDSAGNEFTIISNIITDSYEQFTGAVQFPSNMNNSQTSDVAYVDIYMVLPLSGSVNVSAFQIVEQAIPEEIDYFQDSPARQIDHTFHVYKDSIILQPKENLLTGWTFGQNPWQFTTTTPTTPTVASVPVQCAYTADQTIVYQQTGASKVLIGQAAVGYNNALSITAIANDSQFATIQYIDAETMAPYWGHKVSLLFKGRVTDTTNTPPRFKVCLIWSTTLPPSMTGVGPTYPILSWSGPAQPVFQTPQWNVINPKNDPTYQLSATLEDYSFDQFQLPAATTSTMVLGIVIYTLDGMDMTAPSPALFDSVTLVRNDFAIDSNVLTFNETLARCQYYYETSKNLGYLPNVASTPPDGALIKNLIVPSLFTSGTSVAIYAQSFGFNFNTVKRADPLVTLYRDVGSVTSNTVTLYQNATNLSPISPTNLVISGFWNVTNSGQKGVQYTVPNAGSGQVLASIPCSSGHLTEAYIAFHFTADSRIGA